MSNNVNYEWDILIFPETGNLSDITNTDVSTNFAFNIKILNLVDDMGIAIFNPIENRLSFHDSIIYDIEEFILNDMTVYAHNVIDIYIDSDTSGIVQLSAYLYDNDKNIMSDIFYKNINLNYIHSISLEDINIDTTPANYDLDGTIVYIGTEEIIPDNLNIMFIHSYGAMNKGRTDVQYEWLLTKKNIISDSTNLNLTLISDGNLIYNITNVIELYLIDQNNNQVSEKLLDIFEVGHINCYTPTINPTITNTNNDSKLFTNNTTTFIGTWPVCTSSATSKRVNIKTYKPYEHTQKDWTLPIFFTEYSTTSITITSLTSYKIISCMTAYPWDEIAQGVLDLNLVTNTLEKSNPTYANSRHMLPYDKDSILLKFYSPVSSLGTGDSGHLELLLYRFSTNVSVYDDKVNGENFNYSRMPAEDIPFVRFDDYTSSTLEAFTGYNLSRTTLYELYHQQLTFSTINSGVNTYKNLTKWRYFNQRYSYYTLLPLMVRVESSHRIRFSIIPGHGSVINENSEDIADRSIIDEIIIPGIPLEIRETSTKLIDPDYTYSILEVLVELLDTIVSAEQVTIDFWLSPVKNESIYILKSNVSSVGDYDTPDTKIGTLGPDDTTAQIEWLTFNGGGSVYTPYYVDSFSANKKTLQLGLYDTPIQAQPPLILYDKILNDYGDVEITMSPFTGDTTNTLSSLKYKISKIDSTDIIDLTTIDNLDIGDKIHIFGFDIKSHYYLEYYTIPNDVSIASTPIEKYNFKTINGICTTPIVVRDQATGYWTITCEGLCRPAYALLSTSVTTGNTMHHIYWQYNYTSFPEVNITHPNTGKKFNMYTASPIAVVCMANYTIYYATMAAGAQFQFSCIGSDTLDYASSVVTESENYPNQCMVPVGTFNSRQPGSSTWTPYELNYSRGSGVSSNPKRYYRKNGAASLLDGGSNTYFNISMSINDVLEVRQGDYNGNYGLSWIVSGKRWA